MIDFIGIGAQKCGTSWLYQWLRTHPELSFPAGKEVHFWDKRFSRGLAWYNGLFINPGNKLAGEITPAYAVLPRELIIECHRAFPHIKIIYTIRNPIDRAWSAAKMVLSRSGKTLADTSDEWFSEYFRSQECLSRGDYEQGIRNWSSIYDPGAILVMRFEDLVREPAGFLNRCCTHLGVEPLFDADQPEIYRKVFNGTTEPIRESLLEMLISIYGDKIESLADFLSWDTSEWLPSRS